LERYIAIDNVCAWPNLTLLPDGDIVATIFNQPCHGLWEGDVECWSSSDGGAFWRYRGTPAPHEPATNRMNVAAGLARNGDLVVLASGWGGENFRGGSLPVWVCRSADGGATWAHTEGGLGAATDADEPVPFGDIVQLADGTLGVTAYCRGRDQAGERKETHFFRSRDDGMTWDDPIRLGVAGNETDLLVTTDGLLAAVRSWDGGHLQLYRSTDHGMTWESVRQLTGPREHPAHLLQLDNGHILLAHGTRHRGCYGVGVQVSDDNGASWYTPGQLVNLEDAWDGGYPSSVQLADGTIVTAYYASGVAAHRRYHMGVVRWRLDDVFRLNQVPEKSEHQRFHDSGRQGALLQRTEFYEEQPPVSTD
jgi:hypothetical protein